MPLNASYARDFELFGRGPEARFANRVTGYVAFSQVNAAQPHRTHARARLLVQRSQRQGAGLLESESIASERAQIRQCYLSQKTKERARDVILSTPLHRMHACDMCLTFPPCACTIYYVQNTPTYGGYIRIADSVYMPLYQHTSACKTYTSTPTCKHTHMHECAHKFVHTCRHACGTPPTCGHPP